MTEGYRAVVVQQYGPPESAIAVERLPVRPPQTGEVAIRVVAAGVNAGDWHLVRGTPWVVRLIFGLRRPKMKGLGTDIAGTVEALGPGVSGLHVGDAVFADLSDAGFGGFAEWVCVPASAVVPAPTTLSPDEQACLPMPGGTALQALRDHGELKAGERVLVVGASGGVGSLAVRLAKHLGATVTGVARGEKLDYLRSLGVDLAVDYRSEDVTRRSERYDLIVDAGAFRSVRDYRRIMSPTGRYVHVGGTMRRMVQTLFAGKRYRVFVAKPRREDLETIRALADQGVLRPTVGARYGLSHCAAALNRVETGDGVGRVVIHPAEE